YSTIAGAPLAAGTDLKALLLQQLTSPVRFTAALAAAAGAVDLWLEVGPGQTLSGLAAETGTPAVALDAGSGPVAGWLRAPGPSSPGASSCRARPSRTAIACSATST